jgi:hypothetical protein
MKLEKKAKEVTNAKLCHSQNQIKFVKSQNVDKTSKNNKMQNT